MLGWVTIGVTVASSETVHGFARASPSDANTESGADRPRDCGGARRGVPGRRRSPAVLAPAARQPDSRSPRPGRPGERSSPSRRAVAFVDSDQSSWPVAVAIAQQLDQHGYSIAARPNWQFLYDDSTRLNGKEAVRVLVLAKGSRERGLLGRDDRLADRASGFDLYVGR